MVATCRGDAGRQTVTGLPQVSVLPGRDTDSIRRALRCHPEFDATLAPQRPVQGGTQPVDLCHAGRH
jgi:hypothetical protein